jgi:hypothetical protein
MIVLLDPNDSRAVRNKDNVLSFYDLVINKKKSQDFVDQFMTPSTSSTTRSLPTVRKGWGISSARSPRSAPTRASSSTRSSPSTTMCLLT